MKIIETDMYLDGGTVLIITDEGDYAVDDRMGSNTPNKIYNGYPLNDNSNLIENQSEIVSKLKKACNESEIDSDIKNIIHNL